MQASAICVLVFVVALAIVMMFRWPWLAVGGFWFLGSLAPVIGLVRVGYAPVADRYSYLPSIGLAIAIVWGLGTVARRKPWLGRLSAGVAMIVATTLIIATRVDLRRWKDSGALFEDASRNAPHKISLNNFAFFLIKRGDYTRASDILSQAIELDPNYGVSYGNRTMAKALLGDYEAAKSDYDQAIRRGARPIQPMRLLSPSDMTPNLVAVSQDPEAAWYLYADVARLEPRKPESFLQRASFRAIQGNIAGALADYDKAIQLGDSNPAAYTGRGNTHVLAANWPAALADLTRAIELSPTNAASYQNRAVVFFKMEAFSNAWSDVARCREFGGTPHESFLDALSKASGRHE